MHVMKQYLVQFAGFLVAIAVSQGLSKPKHKCSTCLKPEFGIFVVHVNIAFIVGWRTCRLQQRRLATRRRRGPLRRTGGDM